jgi:hypothetical protein
MAAKEQGAVRASAIEREVRRRAGRPKKEDSRPVAGDRGPKCTRTEIDQFVGRTSKDLAGMIIVPSVVEGKCRFKRAQYVGKLREI